MLTPLVLVVALVVTIDRAERTVDASTCPEPGRQLAAYDCQRSRLAVSETLSPERLPRVATLAKSTRHVRQRKTVRMAFSDDERDRQHVPPGYDDGRRCPWVLRNPTRGAQLLEPRIPVALVGRPMQHVSPVLLHQSSAG